ncbi:reverse transcriptase domain-containing protein [Tanacetum coccineum]
MGQSAPCYDSLGLRTKNTVYLLLLSTQKRRATYSANGEVILALYLPQKMLQIISKRQPNSGEHNISYRPRTAVKGQILADFLIEKPETDAVLPQSEVKLQEPWILFTDGSSCVDGSGAGLILTNPEGMEFTYALRFEFTATNNEAEYEALIAGLRIAARMGVRNLEANVDSRLVANLVLADYVLREIHAGSCSMHSGPRSVVARALRSGYYWPTMHRDARDMIKKCNDCQVHRPIPRQPQQELTPITSPWPFHKWGIDIAGPFPVAAGGLKFLIVAIDYFTKWIEARAVATITGNQAKDQSLSGWDIKAVGRGIVHMSSEIGMPTIRTAEVNIATNDDERRIDLDILEERREQAAIREEKAKLQMKGYYDAKVRGVSFRPGDFVYRANGRMPSEDTEIWPKWEGPYEVTEALGKGAYKLRDMDGRELPRTKPYGWALEDSFNGISSQVQKGQGLSRRRAKIGKLPVAPVRLEKVQAGAQRPRGMPS